jgi:hypothetical protein
LISVLEALTSSTLRSKVDHVGVVVEEVEDIRLAELIMETVEKIGVYVDKNDDGQAEKR